METADGNMKEPIGLLERFIATSCKVRYEHMFAVVDFGKSPKFDIILGRPFMRQLKMIGVLTTSTYDNRRPSHTSI